MSVILILGIFSILCQQIGGKVSVTMNDIKLAAKQREGVDANNINTNEHAPAVPHICMFIYIVNRSIAIKQPLDKKIKDSI